MSDLVVNVRQVSSYPLQTSVLPTDNILLQRGGLGGPYLSASAQTLVETALNNGGSIGVGTAIPGDTAAGQIFTATNHILPLNASMVWNAYFTANGWRGWGGGLSASMGFSNLGWSIVVGTAAGADQPVTFSEILGLSTAGAMVLPYGTLTVARDPAQALEVATMGYVSANTVASFNARKGAVQLSSSDIYQALCLDGQIATQTWVCEQLNAAFQAMLAGTVVRWNNRSGNVFLMLSDISCVFMQPGQQPITQTPPSTSDDYSIANTAWVTQYVADTLGGGTGGLGLATETWVKANTVASFNGRIGAVTLALSDITTAGGAPLNSPQLSGVPTAPTQAVGNASAAIATTAFVWSAVQESTTGVVSWNGRTGVVTLTGTDINDAGGALLASPAFTGVPTAPTAATGTTTTQLATCAFVLNEVQAIGSGVTSFNTRSGNVVLELTDIESAGGAPIASPNFSGVPTVPTPVSPVAATTTIANTSWVVQYCNLNTVASFNSRIGAVTLNANDITAAGGLANPNVALTGAPTAPTMVPGTNSTAIATCAFVTQAIQNIGGVTVSPSPPASPFTGQAWFNTTSGVQQLSIWTGAAWTPSTNLTPYAPLASPAFTGVPTVPTAVAGTNTNQAASTGFVTGNFLPLAGGALTGNLNLYAPTSGASLGACNLSFNATPVGSPGSGWVYTVAGMAGIIVGGLTNAALSFYCAAAGAAGAPITFTAPLALLANAVNINQLTTINAGLNINLPPNINIAYVAPNGGNCATFYTVTSTRSWWTGVSTAGNWVIVDQNAGATRFSIDLSGNATITGGALAAAGNISTVAAIQGAQLTVTGSGVFYAGGNNIGSGWAYAFRWDGSGFYCALNSDFGSLIGLQVISVSDPRLKTNIAPIGVDPLAVVNQITLQQFDLTPKFPPTTTHNSVGFMSDQLATLIPEAISKGDGTHTFDTVNMLPLIAYLVGAVQQLTTRVAALDGKAA